MALKAIRHPDFIGIGAPRTGTTWLFTMLKSHPEIELPSQKAINYFNTHYSNGKEWYFDHFSQYTEKVVGEISPLYFGNESLGNRIHETAPNAKIIVICRDSVERLLSHVKLINTLSGVKESVEERIEKSPHLIEQGLYYKHVSNLLQFFEEEKVLILSYKEISESPNIAYRSVLEFLGVDASFVPKKLAERVGYNITPKFKGIESFRIGLHRFLIRSGLSNLLWFFKRVGLAKLLRKFNDSSEGSLVKEEESPINMERFHDIFREDTLKLEAKFNIKIMNSQK